MPGINRWSDGQQLPINQLGEQPSGPDYCATGGLAVDGIEVAGNNRWDCGINDQSKQIVEFQLTVHFAEIIQVHTHYVHFSVGSRINHPSFSHIPTSDASQAGWPIRRHQALPHDKHETVDVFSAILVIISPVRHRIAKCFETAHGFFEPTHVTHVIGLGKHRHIRMLVRDQLDTRVGGLPVA